VPRGLPLQSRRIGAVPGRRSMSGLAYFGCWILMLSCGFSVWPVGGLRWAFRWSANRKAAEMTGRERVSHRDLGAARGGRLHRDSHYLRFVTQPMQLPTWFAVSPRRTQSMYLFSTGFYLPSLRQRLQGLLKEGPGYLYTWVLPSVREQDRSNT